VAEAGVCWAEGLWLTRRFSEPAVSIQTRDGTGINLLLVELAAEAERFLAGVLGVEAPVAVVGVLVRVGGAKPGGGVPVGGETRGDGTGEGEARASGP
jgi:hypothetical protein